MKFWMPATFPAIKVKRAVVMSQCWSRGWGGRNAPLISGPNRWEELRRGDDVRVLNRNCMISSSHQLNFGYQFIPQINKISNTRGWNLTWTFPRIPGEQCDENKIIYLYIILFIKFPRIWNVIAGSVVVVKFIKKINKTNY